MEQKKREVLRQCAGCHERKEKKELIRVIRTPEGEVLIDFTGRKNGRGVYICNNAECLKIAYKKKSLDRSLRMNVSNDIYQQLEDTILKG